MRAQDATRNPAMWERWDTARGGFRLVLSCLVSAQVVASFVPTPARSCQSSRSCFAKSPRPGEVWTWAAPVSGTGNTGGGSRYAAILAHAGGALYGTEFGSVTLKRIVFFCFPIKHSTHTLVPEAGTTELGSVTLKRICFFCFPCLSPYASCVVKPDYTLSRPRLGDQIRTHVFGSLGPFGTEQARFRSHPSLHTLRLC